MNDLALQGIADALLEIGAAGKTGALRVGAGGRFRMAFFEEGALVYAVSDVPEESLVRHMTRAGRLESPEARAALAELERQVSKSRPLVTLVRERGLVDEETLRAWLVEYAYDVFAGAFASRGADVRLVAGLRAEHPLPFRLPVAQLVLEAVGRIRSPEVIREAVGPTGYYTEPGERFAERVGALPLSFHDGRIASLVEAPIAIEEIVAISGLPEISALRSILALRTVELLAPFYEYRVTDTGKLRRRKAALESGYAVDVEAAAAALGFALVSHDGGKPVTIDELAEPAPPADGPAFGAPAAPAPRRGETTRLNLLSSAYIGMAEAEAAVGNYAGAAECFESALAQRPNDLAVLLAYAAMHAKRAGGISQAEKLLEQAAEAHPRSAAPHAALARLYHQAGRDDDAEDALAQARRLEPNSADVRLAAEQVRSRGGLFSKLKLRKEPSGITPPARPAAPRPPSGVRPPPARLAFGAAASARQADGSVALRCRHCGRAFDHKVSACPSCGATL